MTHGNGVVVEQITEDQFLSWGEATEIKTKRVFVERYGKYIEYKTMIPLDVVMSIQARHPKKDRASTLAKTIEILKAVMVMPPITDESARAVMKADAALITSIIADVLPGQEEEIEESAGE
jgi:hypothetical protein